MDDIKKKVNQFAKTTLSDIRKFMKKTSKNIKKGRKKLAGSSKNLNHRRRIKKDKKARTKAERLAKLPKSRLKRIFYYLHPIRAFKFWFSKRGLILGLKITGIGLASVAFLIISLFAYYRREIDKDPKNLRAELLDQTTKFYDNSGEHVIYNLHGDEDRTWVELSEISDYMEKATIAIEDKDFYSHGGFSIRGIARAAWSNIFGGDDSVQGGSTITQQFVKNALLSNEKSFTRKIKELILALEIERLYTKNEILEFYLNEIPYGGTEYGVEAASQSFFNKSAVELQIDEAALLAALPQAPSFYSPYGDNTEALESRAHTVIFSMQQQGYITQEQAVAAIDEVTIDKIIALEDKNQFKDLVAPHFVVEVQRQLEDLLNKELVLSGGLKVITTLDYDMQKQANWAIKNNMTHVERPRNGRGSGGDNAALVAVDIETGQVVSMVGSRDYNYPGYGAFNAALASRQPGSSFKPYVYSQLFYNERWGPDSYIYDTAAQFNNYKPQNFDFSYRGRIQVRQAIGESRNIPAVKAMHIAGVDNVLDLARALGNKSLGANGAYLGLSAALGAGEVKLAEHTQAYSSFARGGVYLPQIYILKVENSAGEVIYEYEQSEGEQVLDPQNAYLITNVLTDDAARSGTFGYGNPRLTVSGLTHAVKTGTTNGSTDGWMMGYTRYYAVGVWVGNHDNADMNTTTSWQTGPIFTQFMRDIHRYLEDVPIYEKAPAGIKTVKMDTNTGWAASDASKNTRNGIFASWYIRQVPPEGNVAYTIDSISGNLATDCTPDLAREDVKGSKLWPEILPNDPFFGNWSKAAGYNATSEVPTATDNVHACTDVLPGVTLNVADLGGGDYEFQATVTKGTHPLDELAFIADGVILKTKNINATGSHTYIHNAGVGYGDVPFTVRVVDKVLYATEASAPAETGTLVLDYVDNGGGDIDFSWAPAIPAASKYKLCITPPPPDVQVCPIINSPDTFYNSASLTVGLSYTAFVQVTALSISSSSIPVTPL